MTKVEKLPILLITEGTREAVIDVVVREFPLTIILNDKELVTLLCSPNNLRYLAVGFLLSEGLIKTKDEIGEIILDETKGEIHIKTREGKTSSTMISMKPLVASGGGKGVSSYSAASAPGAAKIESQTTITTDKIHALVNEFQHSSPIYQMTGGVHSAALCDTEGILVFGEDIGRHNTLDKIFGECTIRDIKTDDKIAIISGRISSEMLLKVAKRRVPILISLAAPTNVGVKLASGLGMTLVGFVKEESMNVYSGEWRIMN